MFQLTPNNAVNSTDIELSLHHQTNTCFDGKHSPKNGRIASKKERKKKKHQKFKQNAKYVQRTYTQDTANS